MSEHLHVVCQHCSATNRVLRERLDASAKCGKCGEVLFAGRPFELSGASFDRHVGSNDLPLVVDFWAPWCGPCRMMAPAYEKAASELAPHVRFAKLNTEAEQGIAARFGIRGIPTLIAFRNGREIARQSGALDAGAIVRWVQSNLAAA